MEEITVSIWDLCDIKKGAWKMLCAGCKHCKKDYDEVPCDGCEVTLTPSTPTHKEQADE